MSVYVVMCVNDIINIFEKYGIEVQHLDRLLNQIRTANANIVAYQFKEKE